MKLFEDNPDSNDYYQADKTGSATDLYVFPVSFSQERLWLVDRLTGVSSNYNISRLLRLQGKLDVHVLEAALNAFILRHETLRTSFTEQDGAPVQVIQPSLSIPLTVVDLAGDEKEQRTVKLTQLIQANQETVFDLEKCPLFRQQLLCLSEEEYIFQLTFHHIITDGWSIGVLVRELSALYGAFSDGKPSPLPELPIQYADYTVWQREWLQGETMARLLNYWKRHLEGTPTLRLPTDKPRPAVQSFRGESLHSILPTDLSEGLKALCRREGVTLFMTMLTAVQVLLHRYCGQDDIVVGTPFAGRTQSELEGLFGFFVNTLVLRTDLSGNPSFRELLSRVREDTLGAFDNQDMPFEKLVEVLQPQRDLSRNPLFQFWFVMENFEHVDLHLDNVKVEYLPVRETSAKFDLAFYLEETPRGVEVNVVYATDLFEAETITRLIGHFQTLLEGIVVQPEARLSDLPLLSEPERRQLLVEWNDTAVAFPQDRYIHQLFEEQAARTPEAVAVVCEGHQLTYGNLNARANQLAHHLRGIGVEPEALVGICVERSLEMVVGLLATLKAGGAYVPLDPAYPRDRLIFILKDCAPVVLLTQGRFEALFEGMAKVLPVLDLSVQSPLWANQPESNPDHDCVGLTPENLVNVLYTSGSTGKPKGVGARHRGLQNLLPWYISEFNLSRDDAILVATSHSYDLTQRNIFGPLLVGARLVLASEPFDPQAIVKQVAKERISMMNLTPSGFHTLIDANTNGELRGLRLVVLGGEPIQPNRLLELPEPRPEFVNGYGPTECTGVITYHRMSSDLEHYRNRYVPIGKPIQNTRIYVLDSHQQPVPVGVLGEIHIAGAPVGRGYLNRPELTAERFVRDPFVPEADARLYKTGDLGRWLADGTIELLGRNDFQVKIRGFRIELGEIEAALREHPQLREVVASVYEPVPGDKRLAAYVVAHGVIVPTPVELRDFLKSKLPAFMAPSAFVYLDALPLTSNGKLDRKALPQPLAEVISKDYAAPHNEIESKLVAIWEHLLGVKKIGIHDNFFELGGHSLLAVKMVAESRQLIKIDLPLGAIYQSPTVAELAKVIASVDQQPSWYSLVPIQTRGSRPALFAIHTITLADFPRYLSKDQPLYFLRYGMADKVTDNPVELPSVEDLAGHYIQEMQKIQPQGPYYLMGFSFGGLVAYEMACQLAAKGQQVNLVALMDAYLKREIQKLPARVIIQKFFRQSPRDFLSRIKSSFNVLFVRYKYGKRYLPHIYTTDAPDASARMAYKPKIYSGRVMLFKAEESERFFFRSAPPETAWKSLLGGGLEIHEIPGEHFSIFKEPNVQILAAKLIACMDKAINDVLSKSFSV